MSDILSKLAPPRGAKQVRKRIGRGYGSGLGTTAGKGQKGQTSRAGRMRIWGFEGGQMPIQRRLPKRGFVNIFRREFSAVNIDDIATVFSAGATVDVMELKEHGLVPRNAKLVKILGNGEISHALTIKAHAFSKSAEEKIKAAGGSLEILEEKNRTPKE